MLLNRNIVVLNLLSLIYKIILFLREVLYKTAVLKKKKLNCFVVSIGNITLGGTGKTPCVNMLAKLMSYHGKKVVIVSRGYKRKSSGLKVVSDARNIIATRDEAGDEAFYLANALKNVPVIVCKDRYKAGIFAMEQFSAEVIILDDGFQRRFGLFRDLDVVLIDATNPFGNYKLFPSGILREPLNKLSSADLFVLTKSDYADNKEEIKKELKGIKNDCLIVESVYKPVCFVYKDETLPLDSIKNKNVFLLSGIANPTYFEKIIKELGANVSEHLKYTDHYEYTEYDILDIGERFKKSKADFIITTEKDAVRLTCFNNLVPIYSLKIEFELVDENKSTLFDVLRKKELI